MPVNGNGQFDYPDQGWSVGKMRMARTGPLPDQPTTTEAASAKGSMDYDVLEEKIGPEGSAFIKRFDQEAKNPNADPQLRQHWQSWREFWIDLYSKGGKDTPEPGATTKPDPGDTTAKMLPTATQGTKVLEEAAGRVKGKRKEAEAM